MTAQRVALKLPFMRFMDWCNDNSILLYRKDGEGIAEPITEQIVRMNFKYSLDNPEAMIPSESYKQIGGFVDRGIGLEHVIELSYVEEEGWLFTKCDVRLTDSEYYCFWGPTICPNRVPLTIDDNWLLDSSVEHVDQQYWVFEKINIYKDNHGYFTTTNQLNNKDIGAIRTLLRCRNHPLKETHRAHYIFRTLIDVLENVHILYSEELFRICREILNTFVATGMAKVFNLAPDITKPEDKYTGGKFVQLPNFPGYMCSLGGDNVPLDIINVETGARLRLFYFNL